MKLTKQEIRHLKTFENKTLDGLSERELVNRFGFKKSIMEKQRSKT